MKKTTKLKAIVLSLLMAVIMLPMTMFAQKNDNFVADYNYGTRTTDPITIWTANNGFQNDDFGAPLGTGLLILTAAGAGYAISRRKRYFKKDTTLLLAALMLLGMTNCKKKVVEPIAQPTNGNKVAITLNVGGGAKAEVDPPHVNFETGDQVLVASNGHYVGTLTHNGTYFSGDITDPVVGEPLYFYFLGNNAVLGDPNGSGDITDCTVSISDQSNYPHLPVISMGVSIDRENGNAIVNYSSENHVYACQFHNKASLMKFNVTTPSNSPICITGMNNQVTVNFADRSVNDGFSYGKVDANGVIMMKGESGTNVEKWAIVLQQDALDEGGEGTAYNEDGTYIGARPAIPSITMNQYLNEDRPMTVNTHVWNGNLAALDGSEPEGFATVRDGMTIYGTLAANVKISIADGATVTLNNATINNGTNDESYKWAGITCLGNATIILSGTNTVKGFYDEYPGIHVPSGSTLTIQGTGSLNASSNGYGAGIGGGFNIACGNIEIQGGTINATGGFGAAGIGAGANSTCGSISITNGTVVAHAGDYAAGIGAAFANGNYSTCSGVSISGGSVTAYGGLGAAGIGSALSFTGSESYSQCGDISITGGTVVATGGNSTDIYHPAYQDNFHAYGGAGIGTGATAGDYSYQSNCGNITIGAGVTSVTATKGDEAQNSIGKNHSSTKGTCGTVTIGGTVYWDGSSYQNGGNTYLPTSPLTYQP